MVSEEPPSTPVTVIKEDLASEGTVTPRPEPEVDMSSVAADEPVISLQEEADVPTLEASAEEKRGVPPATEVPTQATENVEEAIVAPLVAAELEKSTTELQTEVEKTSSSELSSAAEEQPTGAEKEDDTIAPGSSEVGAEPLAKAAIVEDTAPETLGEKTSVIDETIAAAGGKPTTEDVLVSAAQEESAVDAEAGVDPGVSAVEKSSGVATAEAPSARVSIDDQEPVTKEATAISEGDIEPEKEIVVEEAIVKDVPAVTGVSIELPAQKTTEDRVAVAEEQPAHAELITVEVSATPTPEESSVVEDAKSAVDEEPVRKEPVAPTAEVESVNVQAIVEDESAAEEQADAADDVPVIDEAAEEKAVAEVAAEEDVSKGKPTIEDVAEVAAPTEAAIGAVPAEVATEVSSEAVVTTSPPKETPMAEEPIVETPVVEEVPVEPIVNGVPVAEVNGQAKETPSPGRVEVPAASEPEVIAQAVVEERVINEPGVEAPAPAENHAEESAAGKPVVEAAEENVAEIHTTESTAESDAKPITEAAIEDTYSVEPVTGVASSEDSILDAPILEPFTEPAIHEAIVQENTTTEEEPVTAEVSAQVQTREDVEAPVAEVGARDVVLTAEELGVEIQAVEKPSAEAQAAVEPVPANVALVEQPILAADIASDSKPSLDEPIVESETSKVDNTTPETIIVPESIAKKDSEAPSVEEIATANATGIGGAASEKPTLDIPEDASHIERPKSPWTPSFQVTTIGQGVSLPVDEDIPVESLDSVEEAKNVLTTHPVIMVEGQSTETSADETKPEVEEVRRPG